MLRLFLFILILLGTFAARADPIRFALTNWPPFSISDGDRAEGIDLDVARELLERIGLELEIRKCPFKRCLSEMEIGELDLQSGIARNEERARYMQYLEVPYHRVSVVFHVRRGEADRIRSYDDLTGLIIGTVSKSHYFDPFNKDKSLTKIEVSEEKTLLPMLDAGRIDTYVGTDPNASYDVLTRGYKDRLEPALFRPDVEVPVFFAISRRSPLMERIRNLNKAMKQMTSDGTIASILSQYK